MGYLSNPRVARLVSWEVFHVGVRCRKCMETAVMRPGITISCYRTVHGRQVG